MVLKQTRHIEIFFCSSALTIIFQAISMNFLYVVKSEIPMKGIFDSKEYEVSHLVNRVVNAKERPAGLCSTIRIVYVCMYVRALS